MTARILVVDDILANVKLLEAKLTAEYFDVLTAMSGTEALEIVQRSLPDIVLLDVMMPGMDGFETCRRIKSNPATQHIPVVMITALDQPSDRVQGLEAGAEDFLTKPVNDVALLARVKSLVRLKMITDELRMRAATSERMGLMEQDELVAETLKVPGRILLVEDQQSSAERIVETLKEFHTIDVISDPQDALVKIPELDCELLIVSLSLNNFDGLRLCSHLRSIERTRDLSILVLVEADDNTRLLRGLDIGVNDYLMRPLDRNELLVRVRSQLKRRRYTEQLRDSVEQSMELAITDSLTGLYNRRYMEGHIATLVNKAANRGKDISLIILDIDHFKAVNDTYGHDVGDEVLKEFSKRILKNIRGIDLACRFGGEEFVLVMPDTDLSFAFMVGERIRQCIASSVFYVSVDNGSLDLTCSVGVACLEQPGDTPDTILKRADQALYRAKNDGRNRVVAEAA